MIVPHSRNSNFIAMAPKKASSSEDAPVGLTDNELRFIKAVFDNMTQKPDANWDSVANDLGLKDAKCAKERFRQMSVRHKWNETAAAASSPRKGKNGALAPNGDAKVTKKPRTPKTPKKVKKEESESEEAEGGGGDSSTDLKSEEEEKLETTVEQDVGV
jgi:hypothetical protein